MNSLFRYFFFHTYIRSRIKICGALLHSLITRIEHEQNQTSIEKNPKLLTADHRRIILTRLLNERVDNLRKEFIGDRLNRKAVLVKEQVQTQRLKQQELIVKKQQQQESSSVDEKKPIDALISPSVEKSRKSTENRIKTKRQETTRTSEQKMKK